MNLTAANDNKSGSALDHSVLGAFCLTGQEYKEAKTYHRDSWIGHISDAYSPYHTWTTRAICLLGVPANVAFVAVLLQPTLRHSTINLLLMGIACCDLVVMAMNFVFNLVDLNSPFARRYLWALYMVVYADVGMIAHTTSLWLTVLIGAIRYHLIRQNNIRPKQLPHKWTVIGAIVVAVLVVNLPNVLRNQIVAEVDRNRNDPSDANSSDRYGLKRPTWWNCVWERANFFIAGLFFKIVPCVLMTYYASALIRLLMHARRRRQRLMSGGLNLQKQSGEPTLRARTNTVSSPPVDRTTVMLVVIVLIFLLTELPQGLLVLAIAWRPTIFVFYQESAGNFLDVMSLVNSSVNFALYCAMSGDFRTAFCASIDLRARVRGDGERLSVAGDLTALQQQKRKLLAKVDEGTGGLTDTTRTMS